MKYRKAGVDEEETATFGGLLRRMRAPAGFTQEELAEASGVSARTISDIERGLTRKPQKATAEQLARALRLSAADTASFVEASRGRMARDAPVPAEVAAQARALPPDVRGFSGRAAELRGLTAAAESGSTGGPGAVWVISGMAGGALARPRSRCTPPTGWHPGSPTVRSRFRCMATRRDAGR